MTRIILRLNMNRNAAVTSSANGGENTSATINNRASSSSSPPPKTLCQTGDGDLPQRLCQKKRPWNNLSAAHANPPPSAAASRKSMDPPAFATKRNSKDTKMGSSSGSPSPKKQDDLSRPILRSMARKRSKSAAQESDSKKAYLGGSIMKDKSTEPTLQNGGAEAVNRSKAGGEVVEWPKFHIELSRQEKEDDFLKIKGTKLPLKPKKRSKATEKAMENCYPGMPLLELTRKRYEVRKQKIGKKQKQRGLKGMEMVDTDSD